MTKTAGEVATGRVIGDGQLQHGEWAHVALIMFDRAGRQPLAQAFLEEGVGEVLAPERGVVHASLGEGSVEVQKSDETGPLAAPVRHRENGTAMGGQTGKNMMRILPHSLGNDERRIWINATKDLDAHFLRVDEAMFLHAIKRMRTLHDAAFRFQRGGEFVLHILLSSPAGLIGSKAEITGGDEVDGLHGWGFTESNAHRPANSKHAPTPSLAPA